MEKILHHLFAGMRRRVAMLITFCIGLTSSATAMLLSDAECSQPIRSIEYTSDEIVVTYEFPEISELRGGNGTIYHSLPGFGHGGEIGSPKLPSRIDSFIVPEGFTINITSTESIGVVYECDYTPIEETELDDNAATTYSSRNTAIYKNAVYPMCPVELSQTYTVRGSTIADILVCPVRYDSTTRRVSVFDKLIYRISFTPSISFMSDDAKGEVSSLSDVLGYNNNLIISNINEVGNVFAVDSQGFEGTVGFVIVTTKKYEKAIQNFVEWKKYLGYTPCILSKDKWQNPGEVVESIRAARIENPNTQYIMIVGDIDDVPAVSSYIPSVINIDANDDRKFYTDLYYGTSSESTFIPEVFVGRVPVNTSSEASVTLAKIIDQEMCPAIDSSFYSTAAHVSKFQSKWYDPTMEGRNFIKTSEKVRDYVRNFGIDAQRYYSKYKSEDQPQQYSTGEDMPYDLTYPLYPWNSTTSDVIEGINNGCFYTLYRGHGSVNGWPDFSSSDISYLRNFELYPVVFSIACLTGKFDEDCFAEKLLKSQYSGACAVLAASRESPTGPNDSLTLGLFDAIWPEPGLFPSFEATTSSFSNSYNPTYRLGQILSQGLHRMKEEWGSIGYLPVVKYQYEVYHLFGDPSMYIYTEIPKGFENVDIVRGESSISVSTNGEPASISFYDTKNDTSYRFETDEITMYCENPSTTVVTLTGHNRLTQMYGIIKPTDEGSDIIPVLVRVSNNGSATAGVTIMNADVTNSLELVITDLSGMVYSSIPLESNGPILKTSISLPLAKGVYIATLFANGVAVGNQKIMK